MSDSTGKTGSNVDADEFARYTSLAQTWWDPQGPFWPLQRLNELRSVYLARVICRLGNRDVHAPQPLKGMSVLDIGCGGGLLSESMAALGASVHGIDVVPRNIEVARLHAGQGGLDVSYEHLDVEALAARRAAYDLVLNMEVVEHVPDVERLVAASAALMAPGGVMVLATINRTLRSWLAAIVGAEYVLRWLPRGTHRWRRFVRPAELERMLRARGLRVVGRTGVRVNPFTRRFSLGADTSVNYMLVAVRDDRAAGR